MGNRNSLGQAQARQSSDVTHQCHSKKKSKELELSPNSQNNRDNVTCSKSSGKCKACRSEKDKDEFVIHGIDYLPEFAKRKERRKKNVPKFLNFEESLWPGNYLNFWNRLQNGFNGNTNSINRNTAQQAKEKNEAKLETNGMSRSVTAAAKFSDEKLVDWKTYPNYPFKNIVMSGGGSKGYAYIGSLKALEDCGILRNVSKIAGSSAGAICAGLLAVGCSPQEIADVFKCDIKWLFHDQTCAYCCCLPRVCNKYGIHPAKRFRGIYGEHLKKKIGNPDITFLELKETRDMELCIVVTNLSRMCSEYLTYRTSPNMPIRDAVRMSMAFPVVFRAIRYNTTGRECIYTDGGLLDQYPVHCFDDVDPNSDLFEETYDNNEPPNMDTLGLYVVSEKPIDHKIWQSLFGQEIPCKPTYLPNTKLARERLEKEMSIRKMHNKKFNKQIFMDELCSSVGDGAQQVLDHYEIWNKSHVDIRNFGEYFITAIETLLISQRKLKVKPNDSLRTVPINCGYIGTNDYVIEPGDREFMLDQGYLCTVRFLREFISTRRSSASCSSSLSKRQKVPRSISSELQLQFNELHRHDNGLAPDNPCSAAAMEPTTVFYQKSKYFLEEENEDVNLAVSETKESDARRDEFRPRDVESCSADFHLITNQHIDIITSDKNTGKDPFQTRDELLLEQNDAAKCPSNGSNLFNNNNYDDDDDDGGNERENFLTSRDAPCNSFPCLNGGKSCDFPKSLDYSSTSVESECYIDLVARAISALGDAASNNSIPESRV